MFLVVALVVVVRSSWLLLASKSSPVLPSRVITRLGSARPGYELWSLLPQCNVRVALGRTPSLGRPPTPGDGKGMGGSVAVNFYPLAVKVAPGGLPEGP